MEGAIIMAAMSALETGVGLCTLLTTKNARQIIAGKIPELITRSLDCLDVSENAEDQKPKDLQNVIKTGIKAFFNEGRRYDTLIIGPGMGRTAISSLLFNAVIDGLTDFGISRVLVDGDGLYHLSEYLKKKKISKDISFVITPHFYEASRFMEKSVDEIENNRLKAAVELAEITHSVALLKGPSSIISDGASTLINTTGNSGLATAGSGDVLSGIIGALLLKDMKPIDSAGIGAYIHGFAADLYVNECKSQIIKATDVIDYIRKVIMDLSASV
jgi:NAD(P)H-hydrate epimerase